MGHFDPKLQDVDTRCTFMACEEIHKVRNNPSGSLRLIWEMKENFEPIVPLTNDPLISQVV